MKRSGRLARFAALARTPFRRRNTAPLRRTPLATSRPSVSPEERRTKRLVRLRAGEDGLCECCYRQYGTDASHRKRRTQGGPWCPSNILWACRGCHALIDDPTQPTPRYCGWHIDPHQDPLSVPVYLPRRGWVRLLADGTTEPCSPPDSTEAAA